jgi:hypothetical protein
MFILPKAIYELGIQLNLHQNFNVILHRKRKTNPKIHMETLNNQSNSEQILSYHST